MHRAVLAVLLACCSLLATGAARAAPARTIDQYRHFRALSLDLNGRLPTRAELAEFESDGFDVKAWIDAHTAPGTNAAYADRLSRAYLDLLRLQIGGSFQFVPSQVTLRRMQVNGPDGNPVSIFWRLGQRRAREETDGVFCLTLAETGYQYPNFASPTVPDGGAVLDVPQSVLDQYTTLVSPWWLYGDYQNTNPVDKYPVLPDGGADLATWAQGHPGAAGFQPAPGLLAETPDGGAPVTVQQVRVCNEEAQTAPTGTTTYTGRCTGPVATQEAWCSSKYTGPPPFGRLNNPPRDSGYAAQAHAAQVASGTPLPQVDCSSQIGFTNSTECGCGPGLERCQPGAGLAFENNAFSFQSIDPLGPDQPLDKAQQPASSWERLWWGEEAAHLLTDVFAKDRPFTDLLTARDTWINGPLAQFYRTTAQATCCGGNAISFGMLQPQPLFDPAKIPTDLKVHASGDWRNVDRGPLASGLLTMPVFLTKYGSRRARAHVLYQAFLCRDFVAPNVQLTPSTNPNLMQRNGCQACHAKLEPLAAYFSRISESDWTFLPSAKFPLRNPLCKTNAAGAVGNGNCTLFYDPAFADSSGGTLRGGYPDIPVAGQVDSNGVALAHADLGPAGIAAELIGSDQFASCVAKNVAESFLGRRLTSDDAQLQAQLAQTFIDSSYSTRALVKALLLSPAYFNSNNLVSSTWRTQGAH
jgi:hypothetical protein